MKVVLGYNFNHFQVELIYQQMPVVELSTGERPFIDILQDRRYWVIHVITIPSLFVGGVIFIDSPFVYKLFGRGSFNQYFYNQCISLD